ncbi:MAG: T9SS type A sorting domain-containing protein [Bacteroidetes bacterium]|nr:MAG: T9SS type A sorting domain-containing protein [Bacteroidota bacterium]
MRVLQQSRFLLVLCFMIFWGGTDVLSQHTFTRRYVKTTYDYVSDVALDDHGNTYLLGASSLCFNGACGNWDLVLVKLDPAGEVVFKKAYTLGANSEGKGKILVDGKRLVIYGELGEARFFRLELDLDGELLHCRSYQSDLAVSYITNFVKFPTGKEYIRVSGKENGKYHNYLLETDNLGQSTRLRDSLDFSLMKRDAVGNMYIASRTRLAKYASDESLIWSVNFKSLCPNFNMLGSERIIDFSIGDQGQIALMYYMVSKKHVVLAMLDEDGQVLRQHRFYDEADRITFEASRVRYANNGRIYVSSLLIPGPSVGLFYTNDEFTETSPLKVIDYGVLKTTQGLFLLLNQDQSVVSAASAGYNPNSAVIDVLKSDANLLIGDSCSLDSVALLQTESCLYEIAQDVDLWKGKDISLPVEEDLTGLVQITTIDMNEWFCGNCIQPKADFDYEQSGNTIHLNALGPHHFDYEWIYGDGNASFFKGIKVAQHSYQQAGNYELCLVVHNDCGTDTLCKNVELSFLGIENPALDESGFSIFPNPGRGIFQLITPKEDKDGILRVYNCWGVLIREQKLEGNPELDLSGESPGIYIVQYYEKSELKSRQRIILSK